ncbi:MAG: cysteine--1-D-myo-inosityl 2-amino-2-deoxy-alpha-D-glucopyranoside ligase, partial [Acidimicrobiales bacterium]
VLAAQHGGKPDDPNKGDPLDFVLWQPSAPDEPAWESLWGPGRPGWHIECSALALRELGETIDLHGGGSDLIFPHHECETAQSEAATGSAFVRHWMHVGLVGLGGEKMSKSLGNLVFVGDLLKDWEAPAVRLSLLAHHYRDNWDWDDSMMQDAGARLESWRSAAGRSKAGGPKAHAYSRANSGAMRADPVPGGEALIDAVRACLDDDLNVPGALRLIDQAVLDGMEVAPAAGLIGVSLDA